MLEMKIRKLATMSVRGVPVSQICQVLQLSDPEYTELVASEDYIKIYAELTEEQFEKQEQFKTLDNAWDFLEATALNTLAETMEWMQDSDFALRVAGMANKAQRKNDSNHQAIDGRVGARAVINLKMNFINQLNQAYKVVPHNKRPAIQQKETDIMTPDNVEKLLMSRIGKDSAEIAREIPDFGPEYLPAE